MIDIDKEAVSHLERINVPDGPGLEAVMKAGGRRRRIRTSAGVSAVAAVVGIAVIGASSLVGDPATTVDVAAEGLTASASSEDSQVEFVDALPDRDVSPLATEPVPELDGWSAERVSVELSPRYEDAPTPAMFELTNAASTIDLTVLPGSVGSSDGTAVDLVRPDQTVDAWRADSADGTVSLTWNERGGANSGFAVIVRGVEADEVLSVAQGVEFVAQPLAGATSPVFLDLSEDREPILSGEADGVGWQVSDNGTGIVIEINGQSPEISSSTGKLGPFDAKLTSVSRDGLHVHLVELPGSATAAAIVDGERFAARSVTHNNRSYAVVVVPRGKDAFAIEVANGDETLIVPLPLAPETGWTAHRLDYDQR